MIFIFIALIILFIFEYNNFIDSKMLFTEIEPYYNSFMENDYRMLAAMKYGPDVDANKVFSIRIRNGVVGFAFMFFVFLTNINFINILFAVLVGYAVYKLPYIQLQKYYKQSLNNINMMLPFYLKSLEILIQHYTVPVALARSVETAPDVFKPGLKKLIARIDAGDSTVEPYMDFAKEYPVRDSMRMMRLLYRLSLGSQENKQEQLVLFSKNVSSLQAKAREQRYAQRLETMENKTMIMLTATGSGILLLLLISVFMMMQI